MSAADHRWRWSRSTVSAENQRRAMTQRSYAQAVQIRKRRKEERLLEKRRQPAIDLSNELRLFLQSPSVSTLKSLTQASSYLQTLVEANQHLCYQLLNQLKCFVLQQGDDNARAAAFTLLETLVSTKRESNDDMYYGSTPTRWSDLVCQDEDGDEGVTTWMEILVKCLPKYQKAVSILAHVFQDSTRAQYLLIPGHWNNIVAALPLTAQLCAVVLQSDSVTPAAAFLESLTEAHLVGLFEEPSTATAAAWILEGLTRREDDAVPLLCGNSTIPDLLLQKLRVSTDPSIRLPLLRTIGNIVTACEGQCLSLFLEPLAPLLPELLSSTVADEVLWVMGCFLVDAGLPHQVITTSIAPLWIPHLLQILDSSRTFDVKREALNALWNALSVPPDVPLTVRDAVQEHLDVLLRQRVWHASLLDALWPFTAVDHAETVVVALRILQRLADTVPDSHDRLVEDLDRLQAVRDRHTPVASDMAANLIDQLHDDESDDETETLEIRRFPGNDAFEFGLPNDESGTRASTNPFGLTSSSAGRGRGMTLPAWMAAKHR